MNNININHILINEIEELEQTKEKTYYIYTIIFNDQVLYIGSTRNFIKRIYKHMYNIKNRINNKLYNYINDNNLLNIKFEILEEIKNNDQNFNIRIIEQDYINKNKPLLNTYKAYISQFDKKIYNINRQKSYYLKNLEKKKNYNKQYYNKNLERLKNLRKLYYLNNNNKRYISND
jgi:hypothetical protein